MNNLKELIEKSRQTPALAPIYAMELDRQLRGMAKAPLTFSAKGLVDVDETNETARALGLDKLFDAQPKKHAGGTIYQAEMLAKEGKRSEAIAHAFANAQGPEVNALNLLYANHSTTNPKLRLHFLNKYLAPNGLQIDLEEDGKKDFFHSINSKQTPKKVDGPLVTVIMPAHNAERTIELAIGSLLDQTWQNLQIIVVDDASTDGTLQIAKDMTKRDSRVEVLSSPVNVGPYVCRNLGVLHTRGHWLTVHDADDWAFPDRIEQQFQTLTDANALACTGCMLRMNERGQITRPIAGVSTSEDGYLRMCYVSLMVQTAYFRNELGAWDSVRVGGDAELIERLKVLGTPEKHLRRPLLLCLDHEAGLTNHHAFGLYDETGQTQPLRADYKKGFMAWHKSAGSKKMPAFGQARPFDAPTANLVEPGSIKKVFAIWAKNLELIKASELFDAAWYKNQYPEFKQAGLDAAEHYLVHGAIGATDPGPKFSSRFYLLTRSIKTNPLVHFLRGKDTGANGKRVLVAAAEIAKTGAHEQAICLAETHLPEDLAYTAEILRANCSISAGDEARWQAHLNAYLAHLSVAPVRLLPGEGTVFERLACDQLPKVTGGPLISVIMPAWNTEKTVRKAAQSILDQTWLNLELLIIDDASTDNTWDELQTISQSDSRVKIFRNKINVGPYVSKNIALTQCKGEWITGHDADDWAHPERVALQLEFCIVNRLKACMAGMMRLTGEGKFVRFNPIAGFVHDGVCRSGLISLMIHGQYMRDVLGGWDLVRTSGDSELLRRIETLEKNRVQELKKVTMLCLDNPVGLTNHPVLGWNEERGISPIRALYKESFQKWHLSLDRSTARINLFDKTRKFDASVEISTNIQDIKDVLENYKSNKIYSRKKIKAEVILITNLNFSGGNASTSLSELSWFKATGISYAVVHCPTDDDIGKPISKRYQSISEHCVNWSEVETVEARYLICRHPRVVVSKCFAQLLPTLSVKHSFIVKNNSSTRSDGSQAYEISEFIKAALRISSESVEFCPISIGMRDELVNFAKKSNQNFNLSKMDWNPTFDFELYEADPKPVINSPIRIGRHGRDGLEKWHEDPEALKKIYPDSPEFKIIILGGAKNAKKILGKIPNSWVVYEFGAIDTHKYFSELDVFVYFPNSSLNEAFGRTIVEAMLAGIPVILPKKFIATFGELPLYCEPDQVVGLVRKLANDDEPRITYLTELQAIAKANFSSGIIDSRLALTSNDDSTGVTKSNMIFTLNTQKYRLSLLDFEEVTK